MKLTQLKTKDIKYLREKWYNEQEGVCPILGQPFELSCSVLDHQHKLKDELPDLSGKGICRGILHRSANSFEGKVLNSFKRLGLNKFIELPELLRNLAMYLENNKITDESEIKYIHPTEEPKKQKLTKSSYNKLHKVLKQQNTVLENNNKKPKNIIKYSTNYNKTLEKLFIKHNIEPGFYK